MFCKSFNSFSASHRPSPLCIRGILFPEDKDKPEWTWIKISEDHCFIRAAHLYQGLPTNGMSRDVSTIFFTSLPMRGPKHWLMGLLRNQPTRGENASNINKSLLGLGPPGHLETHWGPMLVVSHISGQASSADGANPRTLFQDVEMHDVWPTIGSLVYGIERNPCLVKGPRAPSESLPGIKINCVGDRVRFHPDKDPNSDAAIYEAVTVPNDGSPETIQWASIIAVMMGLPWLCRVVHNSRDLWRIDTNGEYFMADNDFIANPELGRLHMFLEMPDWKNFDAAAERERIMKEGRRIMNLENGRHYGSVILVHMYGERIHPEHVKMANLFLKEKGYGTLGSTVMDLTGFSEFWDQKQKENSVPGMDLRGVPSPCCGQGFRNPREGCVYNLWFHNLLFETFRKNYSGPQPFVFCDGDDRNLKQSV